MFATRNHRLDFADTRFAGFDPTLTLPGPGRIDAFDVLDQMAQADAADRTLLKLVMCAAGATLLLALATSVGF
jgi:hypothetical protein